LRDIVAQLNAGRYGDSSILSPAGMLAMHTEPPPRGFGMGWESIRIARHRLFNLDGGTTSFRSSRVFDPEAHLGVYIAANVVNAIGTCARRTSPSRFSLGSWWLR